MLYISIEIGQWSEPKIFWWMAACFIFLSVLGVYKEVVKPPSFINIAWLSAAWK